MPGCLRAECNLFRFGPHTYMLLPSWNRRKCFHSLPNNTRFVIFTHTLVKIVDAIDNFINYSTAIEEVHPCRPNPCGPNSECRESNGHAVCSCVRGYLGIPPTCHPECNVNSDCDKNEACSNQKCINPCPGACGVGAICEVINHYPFCKCPPRYTGNPSTRCSIIRKLFKSTPPPCLRPFSIEKMKMVSQTWHLTRWNNKHPSLIPLLKTIHVYASFKKFFKNRVLEIIQYNLLQIKN